MVDDDVRVTHEHTAALTLPFADHTGVPISGDPSAQYRLRLRGFDLLSNPNRHATRVATAFSAPFAVCDIVNTTVQRAAKLSAEDLSSPTAAIPGHSLVAFCAALRAAGLPVPLALEFEAGQNVTPQGDIRLAPFLAALRSLRYLTESGPNAGLTEAQRAIEGAVRAHDAVLFPGTTPLEWAERRRAALEAAASDAEAEWWRQDSLLQQPLEALGPVGAPSVTADVSETEATYRYMRDVTSMLRATGRDGLQTSAAAPLVTASITGDGVVSALRIDQHQCDQQKLTLEQVLAGVLQATGAAHTKLNTLTAAKTGATRAALQKAWIDAADSADLGGVHAETVVTCFNAARQEAEELGALPERPEEVVDRFASQDPELRKRLFVKMAGGRGDDADSPALEHMQPW
jgi:DNA-binding protein YbaB